MKIFNITQPVRYLARVAGLALVLMGLAPSVTAGESKMLELESGQTVEFNLDSGGSIYIQAWDRDEAQISYSDRERDISDYKITIETVNSGLVISSDLIRDINQSSRLSFELMVPRMTNIKLDTAGGSLEIDGLEGTFSGRTAGGTIKIVNSRGKADLRTGGGKVLVKDSILSGEIHTGGGEVLVENVEGEFDAYSGGGNVVYRNVRRTNGETAAPDNLTVEGASIGTVLISSQGGGINVPEAPEGAKVYTGGGNVKVRNASRFVFAQTGGGDVSIELSEGQVKATTGAGDVEVKVSQDTSGSGDIIIETGLGDVWLTVPKDFSMSLDVALGFTRNSSRNFKIKTKLEVETEESESWTSQYGTPRKFIYGTAEINGGLHKVEIRTTNGNVYIKED